MIKRIDNDEGGLDKFSRGYEQFGVHRQPDNSIEVTEWAPGAAGIYLRGEFSKFPALRQRKFMLKVFDRLCVFVEFVLFSDIHSYT